MCCTAAIFGFRMFSIQNYLSDLSILLNVSDDCHVYFQKKWAFVFSFQKKRAFAPLFLDYCGFKIMGCRNNEQSPSYHRQPAKLA